VGCADRLFPGAWKLCDTIRLSVDGEPLAEEEENGEERPPDEGREK